MPGATSCNHCKAVFVNVPQADGSPAPTGAPETKRLSLTAFAGIVIALIVVSCFVLSMLTRGGAGSTTTQVDPISAFVMCKQFVTDRLKSPATAVFPTFGDAGTQTDQLSTVQFRVRAFVDSQNSFGANIRTQYTCRVTSTGGNTWNLDDLTTNP
jgi:hypothetical protein